MTPERKEEIKMLLATGATDLELAERFKVERSTAWRWRKQLKEDVRTLQREAVEVIRGRFVALAVEAVQTVASIMSDPDAPAAARIRAAEAVLGRVEPIVNEPRPVDLNDLIGPTIYLPVESDD